MKDRDLESLIFLDTLVRNWHVSHVSMIRNVSFFPLSLLERMHHSLELGALNHLTGERKRRSLFNALSIFGSILSF